MRTFRILHTADLHLDSAFEGLSPLKARIRREEQRQLLSSLTGLVHSRGIDTVFICGDLFDGDCLYPETGELLTRALQDMAVPVFISPGNHDFFWEHSPYMSLRLPENVFVFRKNELECAEVEGLGARVWGAAFTDKSSRGLLEGFRTERSGDNYELMCLHAEVDVPGSAYAPVSTGQLEASGLDYAAFGHVHKASGLKKVGNTYYSWSGCPEGRGFDETGDKYVNIVTLENESCILEQVSVAGRRYESIEVDVSGTSPLIAVHTALPDDTENDIYRIILTGETETAPDMGLLTSGLSELFFELQLRDRTHLRRDIWERTGEDTLRGIFLGKLREMYDSTADDRKKERILSAVRWGLAALDGGEEVKVHENK